MLVRWHTGTLELARQGLVARLIVRSSHCSHCVFIPLHASCTQCPKPRCLDVVTLSLPLIRVHAAAHIMCIALDWETMPQRVGRRELVMDIGMMWCGMGDGVR